MGNISRKTIELGEMENPLLRATGTNSFDLKTSAKTIG